MVPNKKTISLLKANTPTLRVMPPRGSPKKFGDKNFITGAGIRVVVAVGITGIKVGVGTRAAGVTGPHATRKIMIRKRDRNFFVICQ
jgi:hypothetical protein